ncbi:MAG: SDR family NAD(P)-dependent oxidoreductase [Bacteroidales bacterium]|jgi:hypothetical protein
MKDLKSKYGPWALVAGASEGLGEAFAREIASRGLNVYLIARREEKLQELSATIQHDYGVHVKFMKVDLSEPDQIKDFFSQLDVNAGLVVYNAAYAPVGSFAGLPAKDPEKIVAVNVCGPVLVAHLALAMMIKRGNGGIVLMSSLAGTQGSPKIATYAATKAFNTTFAEGLWKELKPMGIDVLASCAGAILTPGYKNTQHQKPAPGTLTPEQVASKTLNAIGKGPVMVPGTINKLARWLMGRVLPRRWAIELMYQQTKKL